MYIVIPAKPFAEAKTRLTPVLSPTQRQHLSQRLLRRTLSLTRQVGEVVVISRSAAVRRLAKQHGAWALVEGGHGLNEALQQAATWVNMQPTGDGLLILPGDLPSLQLSDLHNLLAIGQASPAVVIAPCHRGSGTNALLVRPPTLFPFAFGLDSFQKHQQAARLAGTTPHIYNSSTLAFDVDIPADLAQLTALRNVNLAR